MTVETSTRKQNFAGGQSSLTFSFRALVDHPEYIKVVVTSGSTQTLLTYNSHYTVSLDADGIGGTVTVSPTYSTAYTYTVYRETGDIQSSDYDDYNQFPADTLEEDIDRRTLISQERDEELDRTAKLPISSDIDDVQLPLPEDGKILTWSGTGGTIINVDPVDIDVATSHTVGINIVLDNGGSPLTTGIKMDVLIPYAATITQVSLLADQTGSAVIDIWKDSYTNYPPTLADSITASAKPTLSSATKYQDSTLTGWTTSIAANSTLRFNIDSVSTITRLTICLRLTKTSL